MVGEKLRDFRIPLMKTQQKFESGRSMIEMLGVLAVIGVLSITGIYGYRLAMAKYKANEAAQAVSMVRIEMDSSGIFGKQQTMHVDLPDNSPVSLAGTTSYPNAGIRVDFNGDVMACKQFMQMYEGSSDFYVVNKCED